MKTMSKRSRTFAFPPGVRVRLSRDELAKLSEANAECSRREDSAKTARGRRSALHKWTADLADLSARAVSRRLRMKPGRDEASLREAVSVAIERALIRPSSK
jgi:hypothetical protein